MLDLTQLETTSKAYRQTGVYLVLKLVTSAMDIEGQALVLQKNRKTYMAN